MIKIKSQIYLPLLLKKKSATDLTDYKLNSTTH